MMKTLKFIVLLTVMLVNVTPYIKDGKLEWKGNEAAAQNYSLEFYGLGPNGCILPKSFTFGIQIHNIPVDPMIHNGTSCSFLVLAAIIGGNPISYSLEYIANDPSHPSDGKGIFGDDIVNYFTSKGVTFHGNTTDMCTTLATGLIGNFGMLCLLGTHTTLAYKFSRTTMMQNLGNTSVEIFDAKYTGSGYM